MEWYLIRHYIWEATKVFVPVLITVGAMWFIDNQNKKRWEKESYLKAIMQKEIEVINEFFNLKSIVSEIIHNRYIEKNTINDVKQLKEKLTQIIECSNNIGLGSRYLFAFGATTSLLRLAVTNQVSLQGVCDDLLNEWLSTPTASNKITLNESHLHSNEFLLDYQDIETFFIKEWDELINEDFCLGLSKYYTVKDNYTEQWKI